MKKILFLLTVLVFSSVAYSQSVLNDKTKYQVRRLATNKGYEAVVPLVCGDGETKKDVKVYYLLDSVNNNTADSLYDLATLMVLNVQAKYKCKNTFSWQPIEITIAKSPKFGFIVVFKGSAENSYGSRGFVDVYFKRQNGVFVDL